MSVLLRTVAACLREVCRTGDVLGRFGGDEFIALLPDTDAKGTLETAKDLLIVTMARARNTGQKFSPDGAAMLTRGQGPVLMEPVKARLTLRRTGTPQVFALDHDGKMTASKIAVKNGVIEIDNARDKTPYYLVRYP